MEGQGELVSRLIKGITQGYDISTGAISLITISPADPPSRARKSLQNLACKQGLREAQREEQSRFRFRVWGLGT